MDTIALLTTRSYGGEISEFACLICDRRTFRIVESYSTLVKPEGKVSAGAGEAGGKALVDVADTIDKMLRHRIWLYHDPATLSSLIEGFARLGKTLPPRPGAVDIQQLAQNRVKADLADFSLPSLASFYGLEYGYRSGGLDGCKLLLELFFRLSAVAAPELEVKSNKAPASAPAAASAAPADTASQSPGAKLRALARQQTSPAPAPAPAPAATKQQPQSQPASATKGPFQSPVLSPRSPAAAPPALAPAPANGHTAPAPAPAPAASKQKAPAKAWSAAVAPASAPAPAPAAAAPAPAQAQRRKSQSKKTNTATAPAPAAAALPAGGKKANRKWADMDDDEDAAPAPAPTKAAPPAKTAASAPAPASVPARAVAPATVPSVAAPPAPSSKADPSPAASPVSADEKTEDEWTTVEKSRKKGPVEAKRQRSGDGAAKFKVKSEHPGPRVPAGQVIAMVEASLAAPGKKDLWISYAVGKATMRLIRPLRWIRPQELFCAQSVQAKAGTESFYHVEKVLGLSETRDGARPAGTSAASSAPSSSAAPAPASSRGSSSKARAGGKAAASTAVAAPLVQPGSAWAQKLTVAPA